ncbi:LysM peptidoglycan-binding domain-containing protein [Anaeromicropila populeti]|uniref:LysM domain-containing protein n=1 Tax=Anaeromicropila populeti TaxID=37658 RepID=A0A1I6LPK5_9FIRM|nr:LysM domain-containing protein [Anaeromicropila populeti]SFS05437.1 LysM domain-containing protein [Anaeromicropila populeti]
MNFETCNGMTYVIKKGDTLYSLSRRYNVPLALILRANPYAEIYNLQIGDEICIPIEPPIASVGEMIEEITPMKPPVMEMPILNSPVMEQPMMENELNSSANDTVMSYVVCVNDSIQKVMDYFDVDMEDLMYYNKAEDILLKPGCVIRIPSNERD